jgi:2-haloalkanoic acid dehalogenase type II
MAKLTGYKLLCFDIYGTLIDWETGVFDALQPALASGKNVNHTKKEVLEVYHEFEAAQQIKTPDLTYSQLLATIHPGICERLNLKAPSKDESEAFGQSIASWPAFPDTVDAINRLGKYFKMVPLSNVDRQSFSGTNSGPLKGFKFDKVITAQDVGSYKPDLRNFEHMLARVKEEFGVERSEILQTAQSQFHDHQPAKKMGIKSVWIVRPGAIMGNREGEIYDWEFDTLGDFADAVEKELA